MSAITTHILDTALGAPATDVAVSIERRTASDVWEQIGSGRTDGDGRVGDLLSGPIPNIGAYRLRFEVAAYFERSDRAAFFPFVDLVFSVTDLEQHYHVPLLLSPFGYSTYRGS